MERHIFANLSTADRGRIIELHEGGYSRAEIMEIIGCSRQTVALWIKKHEEGGMENLKDHRKNNRCPEKTTPEQNQDIIRAVDEYPFAPVADVLRNRELNISTQTVRRRLRAAGIHSHSPAKKIELKPQHRMERLRFAREHLNTPQEEWNGVVWMDEKVFSSSEDGRRRVWRPNGSRLNPKYVVPSGTSGRITIGFWGSMTSNGLLALQEISPRMDAEEYVEILQEVLKLNIRRIYPEEQYPVVKIVQDNSAVHTSRLVQAWFDENPDIQKIRWPAKSPDLNPIENVWGQMTLSWRAGELRTREALRNHVHQVWQQLSQRQNYTQNLVNSMPRRLQQVRDNDGYWIPY
jgi:transposase